MTLREQIRGEREGLERARAAALTRAEAAQAEAAAYAAAIERLERLEGLALADEVLRRHEPGVDAQFASLIDMPPSTGDRNQRCALPPLDGKNTEAAQPSKGSPPCPACGGATIVLRRTGAITCLNDECELSRRGRDEAADRARRPPPPPPPPADENGGRPIDIGEGRGDLPEGTNLWRCVQALRLRAGHWLSTSGVLEVIRIELRKDLPENMRQIVAQELGKQRKLRPYQVPGLQAREVDGRWEYRIRGPEAAAVD